MSVSLVRHVVEKPAGRLAGWLAGLLAGWLAGWLTGWAGWLFAGLPAAVHMEMCFSLMAFKGPGGGGTPQNPENKVRWW